MTEHPTPTEDPTALCNLSLSLRNFWAQLNPLLEQVKAGAAPAQVVTDMQKVTFSEPEMLSWISDTARRVSNSLFKICETELASVWASAEELDNLLAKLPDPATSEEQYRAEGTKLTKQLADAVASIGKSDKLRLKGVSALKNLSDTSLPGHPSENGPNALFQKYQGGEESFNAKVLKSCACASVHVAMVAGVCLLRNEALGATSDEGKLIRQQLEGVAAALKSKVEALQLCADPDKQLLAVAQRVLKEATSAHEPAATTEAQGSKSKLKGGTEKEKNKKNKADKDKDKDKDKKDKEKTKAKKEKKDEKEKRKSRKEAEDEEDGAAEPAAKKPRGRGRGRGRGHA